MEKYDIKKDLRSLYSARTDFTMVDVAPMTYLAIDGHGDPNTSPAYAAAVERLYKAAYAIKFASKREGRDFVVAPLEGLWTADDPTTFVSRDKSAWDWTMLIAQPSWIRTSDDVELRTIAEGRCVQVLHVGSYDDEGPVLARLHDEFMPSRGLSFNGPHHEIYLSDPRRVAPEKLKTILRQPVR